MSKIIDFLEFVVNSILYGAFMIVIGIGFIIFFSAIVLLDLITGTVKKIYKRFK